MSLESYRVLYFNLYHVTSQLVNLFQWMKEKTSFHFISLQNTPNEIDFEQQIKHIQDSNILLLKKTKIVVSVRLFSQTKSLQ